MNNNNHNRQSVNNYVYNRRRNREPEPVRNENDFDFTNQNDDTRQSNSTSMYNSYVSENDYNSYTSGYQTNNYSQPSQNNYNSNFNHSQPPQNNYNNNFSHSQSMQRNGLPVWQTDLENPNRNRPINRQDSYRAVTGHDVREIPLRQKTPLSTIIAVSSFMVTFVTWIVLAIISSVFHWNGDGLMIIAIVSFFIGFLGIAFSMIFGSKLERHRSMKVCKTQVKGRLVGFEQQRRSGKKGHRYYVYAPKYEMFVNNRYEIRTINMFDRIQREWGDEINLLVNPDGYEAIPATKADFPKLDIGELIGSIAVAIFIIVFFLGPLILSLMNSR